MPLGIEIKASCVSSSIVLCKNSNVDYVLVTRRYINLYCIKICTRIYRHIRVIFKQFSIPNPT